MSKIHRAFYRSSAKITPKINEYMGLTFAWMPPDEGWDPKSIVVRRRKIVSPFEHDGSRTSSPIGLYDFSHHHWYWYPDNLDNTYLFEEKARWGARLLHEIMQRRKLIAFGVIDDASQ